MKWLTLLLSEIALKQHREERCLKTLKLRGTEPKWRGYSLTSKLHNNDFNWFAHTHTKKHIMCVEISATNFTRWCQLQLATFSGVAPVQVPLPPFSNNKTHSRQLFLFWWFFSFIFFSTFFGDSLESCKKFKHLQQNRESQLKANEIV